MVITTLTESPPTKPPESATIERRYVLTVSRRRLAEVHASVRQFCEAESAEPQPDAAPEFTPPGDQKFRALAADG